MRISTNKHDTIFENFLTRWTEHYDTNVYLWTVLQLLRKNTARNPTTTTTWQLTDTKLVQQYWRTNETTAWHYSQTSEPNEVYVTIWTMYWYTTIDNLWWMYWFNCNLAIE